MENLIEECPKTWKAYKNHLYDKYGGDETIKAFVTDETLLLNLESTPMSLTHYFDSIGLVGSYHYNGEKKEFSLFVNGKLIDWHIDYQFTKNRKEAEINLIKYLFSQAEKTL